MIINYIKIAWRNLIRSKTYSIINIGGLAVGMGVTILIGLWTNDELNHDTYHENYGNLAQVMVHQPINESIETSMALPMPVSSVLRNEYGHNFKFIASTWSFDQTLRFGDKILTGFGCFTERELPEMLTLKMIHGVRKSLMNNNSIILSESLAKALFGDLNPMGNTIMLTGGATLQVTGVYQDLPKNSSFSSIKFFGPLNLILDNGVVNNNWLTSAFNIFVQTLPNVELNDASTSISNILRNNTPSGSKSVLFLNPMNRWYLYEFSNGESKDGRIRLIRMVSIIGLFVLLLACINFMNLATARSEKRMKEVGIRKCIGSQRLQLIVQFFCETLLVVVIAFVISLSIVTVLLPAFNQLTNKALDIPWSNSVFWFVSLVSTFMISLFAGSYPALYLSALQPVKVLKGTYRAGKFSSLPRKALVIVQFTVSVVLIVGTLIIYKQIAHAKHRPVGYERNGLLSIQPPFTGEILAKYEAFRNEMLATNLVAQLSRSSSPTTNIFSSADNLEWQGKNPDVQTEFGTIAIDPYYDQVVRWTIKKGRNFSADRASDSLAFIFNETAIRTMGIADPIDQKVKWHGKTWTIIGVVEDMVMTSPFADLQPTVFMMNNRERPYSVINFKIDTNTDQSKVLSGIEQVFKKFSTNNPFVYQFTDQEYELKFSEEERIGELALALTVLAIIISCLGLFSLASFIAEQRTKELGIRKILGASVSSLWQMLSKDFLVLVVISCVFAIPISFYFMSYWLQNYEYRTDIPLWIFIVTCTIALFITLLTVSVQTLKAASTNPVKSLRSE